MLVPVIDTPRLRLRPLQPDDAGRIQILFPHWEIVKYMSASTPWPFPEDGGHKFISAALSQPPGEAYHWALTEKSDASSSLIGVISLFTGGSNNRRFWIGRDYQRNGYMTEATIAVTDFAFDNIGMTELILKNAEPNTGSTRLKERSGARIIPGDVEANYVSGIFKQIRWQLSVEDWRANRHRLIPIHASIIANMPKPASYAAFSL